jgi:hypothetical protein
MHGISPPRLIGGNAAVPGSSVVAGIPYERQIGGSKTPPAIVSGQSVIAAQKQARVYVVERQSCEAWD